MSTRPLQVVVGQGGWLFAGDEYAMAVSAKRHVADRDDALAADRRRVAAQAWARWSAENGVADWRVLVCPDKDSIHPDRLPAWVRPVSGSPMDLAAERAAPAMFIDPRALLHQARATDRLPLYLRTDTHWTERGAFVGYGALARSLATGGHPLRWLDQDAVAFDRIRAPAGDLARILQLPADTADESAVARIAPALQRGRVFTEALNGRPVPAALFDRVEAPTRPVLTHSPGALNARRVLWLRDSFGAALHPFMVATFSDVVEVSREATSARQLADAVQRFKPDLVLISVVERNARSAWFEQPPP